LQNAVWGYLFGILSIAFVVFAIFNLLKPGRKGAYKKTRTRSVIQAYFLLFLTMTSLSIFGYTQKPEGLQTLVFCFVGQAFILLMVLSIAILKIHLSDRRSIDLRELFATIFNREK
jgi:hypothetical protein